MNRVLVVDDEPQIVRALVINLKARKYEVDAAPTGPPPSNSPPPATPMSSSSTSGCPIWTVSR